MRRSDSWSVGPSVCRSVGPSIRRSVHPSVRNHFFCISESHYKSIDTTSLSLMGTINAVHHRNTPPPPLLLHKPPPPPPPPLPSISYLDASLFLLVFTVTFPLNNFPSASTTNMVCTRPSTPPFTPAKRSISSSSSTQLTRKCGSSGTRGEITYSFQGDYNSFPGDYNSFQGEFNVIPR